MAETAKLFHGTVFKIAFFEAVQKIHTTETTESEILAGERVQMFKIKITRTVGRFIREAVLMSTSIQNTPVFHLLIILGKRCTRARINTKR